MYSVYRESGREEDFFPSWLVLKGRIMFLFSNSMFLLWSCIVL